MFTFIVIIAIIWFFVSSSNSGKSSSNENTYQTPKPKPNTKIPENQVVSAKLATGSASSHKNSMNTGSSYKPSKSLYDNNQKNDGNKCSKCKHIHSSQTKYCTKCGWDMSINHINFSTNLSGVTFEGRQNIIARTSPNESITLRRDPNNAHDRNAVGVYNSNGKSLGWVPKGYAANIAPKMDKGVQFYAKIKKIVGGNGYHYGIEVRITNDPLKVGLSAGTSKPKAIAKPTVPPAVSGFKAFNQKVQDINRPTGKPVKSQAATAVKEKPAIEESVYLDTVLLRHADNESRDDVLQVVADFAIFKKVVLPTMNRQRINELLIADLEGIFDNTIMLAGGRESNFVHRHYKAILVQLAFQLGFLIHRLSPESSEAKYAQNKMNWLSTMDVKLETKMLPSFFYQNVIIRGESPIVYDSSSGGQIQLWDIDEITYVLSNLTDLGFNFKRYLDKV